jgi:signal transduction histidine kinase
MDRSFRRGVGIAALAITYVVIARAGLAMDAVSGFATLVWPATGLALAVLLVFGRAYWPGVLIGAFVVNKWTGASVPVALGIAVGNTLEAVVGAALLRRLEGFSPALQRLRDVVALVGLAALGSTLVSASIGVGSLLAGGIVDRAHAADTWIAWWIGDVLGDLVVAPVLLVWVDVARRRRWPTTARAIEAALLALVTVALTLVIFGGPSAAILREPYLLFPLLSWAALRFGTLGAANATFLVAALTVARTAMHSGPFVRPTLHESLLPLQTFMAVVALSTLLLGAAIAERRNALRARDSLLSMASHELRTPMTALQLMIGRATRGGGAADVVLERKRIEAIASQVGRMNRLIEELLDVSRILAGRMQLRLEDVDLAEIVREVVARLSPTQRTLVTTKGDDAPIVGRWDRMRVDLAVTNLVLNAIKYGAGKPVQIAIAADADVTRVRVVDQGIGVAPEDRRRIFEAFERATTSSTQGFGLGLWIARQGIEALGGSLEMESTVGEGSTFTLTLPRSPTPRGS